MQDVLDYLTRHRARFVDELIELTGFPSVSAQPQHRADVRRCAEWLRDHCQSIGLTASIEETKGHPLVLARTPRASASPKRASKLPHFLVYGHYDVQPAEPLDLWKTPPFEPTIRAGALFARGSSDNKGQHFAHLKAVEAWLKTGHPLPCDLTFLIEGEEEVGSTHLYQYLAQKAKTLKCDAVIISDNGIPDKQHPALTYALRGISAIEVRVDGPDRDLHSGIYGGSIDNPAMVLCQLLAKLRDARGRIAIPGFYSDVLPLTQRERRGMAKLPLSDAAYRKFLAVPELFGEAGFTPTEQRTARPTVEINGLTSGYQGAGSKTIIPAWASAKLTFRLVPNQDPANISKLVMRHMKNICPKTVKLTLTGGHGGRPYLMAPTGPLAKAAMRTLKLAWGHEPILMREGGSIPIVNAFEQHLGAQVLLLGLALPDDNPHSPNEKFDLECFERGTRMGALLWPELAKAALAA